jgi:putative oxidoreductase
VPRPVTTANHAKSQVDYLPWILPGARALLISVRDGDAPFQFAGAPELVALFSAMGIGQWFRYVTATIEVGSAIALLVPSLAPYGAVALIATMTGAVFTHLFILGGSPLPALA